MTTTRADGPRDLTAETFQAVLFDMDGTLISSLASVERSWGRLVQEFDVPVERIAQFAFHGMPVWDIVDVLLDGRDADERARAVRRIVELEVADTDGITVLPGALEALTVLGPERCTIVTSCGEELARARLRAAGLPAPATLVTADDITRGKPDPEPFLLGAGRLGADPARCLVVEDAASGLTAGRAAGAATLGLRTTAGGRPLGADRVLDDLGSVRFVVTPAGVRVEIG
ncbi:HAD-IA family hydrolase [Cellulomonas hominis]